MSEFMKLKALSHYDGDMDERFGDCILLYNTQSVIVYDCGHTRHAKAVETFLGNNANITTVNIVVSHNDSDHTDGVCELLDWLHSHDKYTVQVFSHQYLKHVDTILDKVDDGRRNRESLKRSLLAEFDNIKKIIETAQKYNFSTIEALQGISIGSCTIVGPTVDEFTDVAAKAVDNRESNNIGEGDAQETVMNAASVQLKCKLDDGRYVLLCGDASPDYIKNIETYCYIQLPHHGQEADAKAIFKRLGGSAYIKEYLISDNTGSSRTSGGSDSLVIYMKNEKYSPAHNTKKQIVELPLFKGAVLVDKERRSCLGDMDSI